MTKNLVIYADHSSCLNTEMRNVRRSVHVCRKGKTRNVYRILVGKPLAKRPFGVRRRLEGPSKLVLSEIHRL